MKKILVLIILSFTTQLKSQCFEIQSILVDACDGGNEGQNEMVIFQVGSTPLNASNMTVIWPPTSGNAWLGLCQNAGTAADVATVNATILGCGYLKEPVAGVLPANAKVLIVTSTAWNPLAQSFVNLTDTLYILFQCAGNTSGHFANYSTPSALRPLNISFSSPAGCSDAVSYDKVLLVNQLGNPGAQDGGAVDFTPAGVASYVNHGCQAPFVPLSVDAGTTKTVCITGTQTFTGTTSGSYTSVQWGLGAGATGSFAPTNSLSTTYTPGAGDNGTVKLYFTAIKSCGTQTTSAKDSVNLTVTPLPLPSITTASATICSGQSAVLSYSLSNAASIGTTTVQWLPSNATTPTISVNTAGTYSVKITNACGNKTSAFTLTVNPTPSVTIAAGGPTQFCAGGSVTYTATSNAGNYNWTGGITTQTITVNTTNTIVVTSTNSCGTATATQATSVIALPLANAGSTNTLTCSNSTLALSGAGGGTYAWTGPGVVSGSATATPIINQPGTYSLTVKSAAGCSSTITTVAISQNTTVPSPAASNSTTLTCATATAALTGTGGGSYVWSGPGIIGGAATATPTVNLLGTYILTVTAANGCTATANTSVTQNTTIPSVTASNSTTLTCTTITAALTGTGGGSYIWSGPGITGGAATSTPTVNLPGTYILTVTAANGCTATANTSVTQNTVSPSVTGASSGTLNCTVLTVNASVSTAASPVSYNWSGTGITGGAGTGTITVNQPGTFSYTVTNTGNNCKTTGSQSIAQNTVVPTVSMPATQTITCASPTVSLIGSASPSSCTPVWTGGVCGGATTYTASACSPNTYTLTVTNPANGCATAGTISVIPSIGTPVVTASNSGSITCTTSNVQITASTTMTPVSYSWTGPGAVTGASSSTGTVSAGGTYQCIVTNTLTGCTSTITTVVPTNTTAVAASVATAGIITCSVTSIVLNASPTGSYTYSWSPNAGLTGASVANPTITQGAAYSVTITNTASGCVGSTAITVGSNTIIPTVTISPNSFTTTCTSPTVQLTATTSTASVSYNWIAPGTGTLSGTTVYNPTASGAGIFTVVVTNTVNGCVSSPSTSSITLNAVVPTATLSSHSLSVTCTTPNPGVSITTSTSSVSYSWLPSAGIASGATTASPTFTSAGTYSAVVTNTVNGCASNISSNVVTVVLNNSIPTITISPSQTVTCTTPTAVISTTVNPSSSINYTWAGTGVTGLTTSSVTVSQPGAYSTTVTNSVNGCSVTASASVTSNTVAPTASIAAGSVTTTCSSPTATLSVTSVPASGVTYSWTAPGSGSLNSYTVSNPTANGSGIFTVTITNASNGCSTGASQATVQVIPDATTPVVLLSANSLTITCTNTTVTAALTSTSIITSYSWAPTPLTSGANPVFNTPGTYNATVTASNGCPTNVSVNVVLNNSVPVIALSSATNGGTLTCITTSISVTPTVTPTGSLTFTWSPGAGILTPINQANATFTAAGIYTLAVTNTVTGCVSSSTNTANVFTVTANNTPPTFTLGTANSVTTTCSAPNATLSGTSNADPNSVYTWITPTSATLTGNPIVNAAAGIYSVTVTNTVNGCSTASLSQNTVSVVADSGIPSTSLTANSVSITCVNPTPGVVISTTAAPVTYSWSPVSGIVPGTETTADPLFNAPGSYSVVVTNTMSGCATAVNSNVVTVTLNNTIPVVALSAGGNTGTITCINAHVTVTPTVTPSGNLTYAWSAGPGLATPASQAGATFTAAGIYTLAVTNTLTGCVSIATNTAGTFTVYQNTSTPTVAVTAVSGNTVIGCANTAVTFSANVTGSGTNLNYNWSNGSNTSTGNITTAGVYTLTVTDAVSGCFTSTQFTVTGTTNAPTVNAGADVNIACGSNSIALQGTSTSTNVSYSWYGPDAGSITSGSATSTPVVTEIGTYTLTVTDNLTGCSDTSTVTVSQSSVTASFTANPVTGISPLSVNFTNTSTGATNYSWDFGDSNTSHLIDPINIYTTGSYTVLLTASSGSCIATATLVIVAEAGLTLEIPNVFTPNGDNVNDVFSIKSTGVKELTLQIYNRWGEKLFDFTGAKASWDGTAVNGNLVPDGTYFYFIKATGFDNTVIQKDSYLNLFR